jgi:hypothetical protein
VPGAQRDIPELQQHRPTSFIPADRYPVCGRTLCCSPDVGEPPSEYHDSSIAVFPDARRPGSRKPTGFNPYTRFYVKNSLWWLRIHFRIVSTKILASAGVKIPKRN